MGLLYVLCGEVQSGEYLSAVVHMDETTPHLHLNLVPIINGKLCSKSLYDKKKLSALQKAFREKVGKKWD